MPDITRVFRALHFPHRRREVVSAADATPINVQPGEMLYDETANKLYAGREDTTAVQVGGGNSSVVTAATVSAFPATGATGVIYLATDTSRTYQWQGAYVEVGTPVGGIDTELRALFAPASPTSVTAAAGNAQATLSWTAPTVLAQTPITDYTVQFSTNSGSTWQTFTRDAATATSAVVTGLANGTAYVFRVAAVNGVGMGAYTAASNSVTPTVGTPPNAPTPLTATPGNTQVSLAWTAPSAPGTYAISGYTVEYTPAGGSAQTVNTGSTSTTYTLTGLTNGTAYTVRVAALSAAGTGAFTASSSVTPSAMAVVTGGTVSTPGDGYTYRTFTSSGTLSVSGSTLTADVLVVGGGGGGGKSGGGGGGVLYRTGQTLNAGSHAVTVAVSVNPSTNAGSSSLGASYTATGGAGGVQNWVNGGTSGFPTSTSNTTGNAGGEGDVLRGCDYTGGGGGGAGGAGSKPPCDVQHAGGGVGIAVWGTTYGEGGGGVDYNGGTNAPANLGRGGSGTSARGGSGVVIIRYLAT